MQRAGAEIVVVGQLDNRPHEEVDPTRSPVNAARAQQRRVLIGIGQEVSAELVPVVLTDSDSASACQRGLRQGSPLIEDH